MCGRYSIGLGSDAQELMDLFRWAKTEPFVPRYNVAPGSPIPVLRLGAERQRELVQLRWGLVPGWARDEKIGYKLINARSETAAQKPSFRDAYAARRCLVPATGFYEWQRQAKAKQPFNLRLPGGAPFAMAGLWERNTRFEQPLLTCTILTTRAADDIAHIHGRMPVIVAPEHYARWLGEEEAPLEPLLVPHEGLEAVPTSRQVNNPKNDGPELVEPYGEQ